jgi:hypothetical protein
MSRMNTGRYIAFRKQHTAVEPTQPIRLGQTRTACALALLGVGLAPVFWYSTLPMVALLLALALVAASVGVLVGDWAGALLAFEIWYFATSALVIAVSLRNMM